MRPWGMALDAEGRLYVADRGNARIQIFSPDGKYLRSFGRKGSGPGELNGPVDVAVTHDGFVFVADAGNQRVQVFSQDGIYFHGFGTVTGKVAMKDPQSIAVTLDGQVYVQDAGLGQVLRFTAGGRRVPLRSEAVLAQGLSCPAQ